MVRSSVWTPRRSHKLWPKPPGQQKFSFAPNISNQPYIAPPPPPPLKKALVVVDNRIHAHELEETAAGLKAEAEALEGATESAPSLKVQLGLLLLSKEDYIKQILKDWDTKGKGEFLKGEFRLNLRNTGLNATSAEADDLFDSWDDDKGGSLDLKELKAALLKVQTSAKQWQSKPNPRLEKSRALRKRAKLAEVADLDGSNQCVCMHAHGPVHEHAHGTCAYETPWQDGAEATAQADRMDDELQDRMG